MNQYRTQVRFPDQAMADQLKEIARQQGRSMNAQIIHLIRQGLAHEKIICK